MPLEKGSYRSISPARRWMCDLAALSQTIPIAALEHRLHLRPVFEALKNCPKPHPSWSALFLKAVALLARHQPYLRRSYFGFPWPRIYEHPINVAAITVEREWQGEHAIFFDMLPRPETMGVMELHYYLRRLKSEPVESIRCFRRLIKGGALPLPFRWLIWRYLHSFSGPRRAAYTGTFAINGGTRFPIRPVTTTGAIGATVYFGLFDAEGNTDVCLAFDHRVMDGGVVVRILDGLESVLNTDIVIELQALVHQPEIAIRNK
ncbi:MAG TPA: hypothetical protein VL981_13600 [Candidatus Methylacidiphilales bacterium]|nr:hypothetical protein [Candidatus Methylacidiphilales bacterium]